jgi:hypothetical protein
MSMNIPNNCAETGHDPAITEIVEDGGAKRKIFKCQKCGIDLGAAR